MTKTNGQRVSKSWNLGIYNKIFLLGFAFAWNTSFIPIGITGSMRCLNSLVGKEVKKNFELKENPYFQICFCYKKEGQRRRKTSVRSLCLQNVFKTGK